MNTTPVNESLTLTLGPLRTLRGIARGVRHVVQPDSLSLELVIKSFKGGDTSALISTFKNYGLVPAIFTGLGLLFCIGLGVAGGCFYCCRCFDRCGGKPVHEKPNEPQKRRLIMSSYVLAAVMVSMAGCLIRGTQLVSTVPAKATYGILTVFEVVDKLLVDANDDVQIILDQVNNSMTEVSLSLATMKGTVVNNVDALLSANATNLFGNITSLDTELNDYKDSMISVLDLNFADVVNFESSFTATKSLLDSKLADIVTSCNSGGSPSVCSSFDSNTVQPAKTIAVVDTSPLPILSIRVKALTTAETTRMSMTEYSKTGKEKYDTLGSTLVSELDAAIASVNEILAEARLEASKAATDTTGPVTGDVSNMTESMRASLRDIQTDYLDKVARYIRLFGTIVGSIALSATFVVICAALFGTIQTCRKYGGVRYTYRGVTEARRRTGVSNVTGLALFATSAMMWWMAVVAWLLGPVSYLVVVFLDGATQPLVDYSFVTDVLDKPNNSLGTYNALGTLLDANASETILFADILDGCRNGTGLLALMDIESAINLSSMIDFDSSSFDVDEIVKTVDFSGVTILSPNVVEVLTNISLILPSEAEILATKAVTSSQVITGTRTLEMVKFALTTFKLDYTGKGYSNEGTVQALVDEATAMVDIMSSKTTGITTAFLTIDWAVGNFSDSNANASLVSTSQSILKSGQALEHTLANQTLPAISSDISATITSVDDNIVQVLITNVSKSFASVGQCQAAITTLDAILSLVTDIVGVLDVFWLSTGSLAFLSMLLWYSAISLSKYLRRTHPEKQLSFEQKYPEHFIVEEVPLDTLVASRNRIVPEDQGFKSFKRGNGVFPLMPMKPEESAQPEAAPLHSEKMFTTEDVVKETFVERIFHRRQSKSGEDRRTPDEVYQGLSARC